MWRKTASKRMWKITADPCWKNSKLNAHEEWLENRNLQKKKKIAIIWKSRMNSRNTAVRKYIMLKPPKLWDCNYYKKKFSCRPYHKTNIYFSLHVIGWHWKKGAYIHGEKTKCELLGYHQRWYHRKLLAWYSYDVAFVCCLISLLR